VGEQVPGFISRQADGFRDRNKHVGIGEILAVDEVSLMQPGVDRFEAGQYVPQPSLILLTSWADRSAGDAFL